MENLVKYVNPYKIFELIFSENSHHSFEMHTLGTATEPIFFCHYKAFGDESRIS